MYRKHLEDPDHSRIDHLACMRELGYALYYMKYSHPGFGSDGQSSRVHDLCVECETMFNVRCKEPFRIENGEHWDKLWFELHFRIQDEIENMV